MISSKGDSKSVQRILLKLSGEALTGNKQVAIETNSLKRLANEIKEVLSLNVQLAIVIGGGNVLRGAHVSSLGIDRVTADQMGMLATVVNALALRDVLEQAQISTRILSAIAINGIVEHFERKKAIDYLNEGKVIIFSAGTGNPLVTTDSAASLRSIEIGADIVLKATNVDGVYSDDPQKNPQAFLYETLDYNEVLDKELGVMDLSAFCQFRDFNMPLRVFNINHPGILVRIVKGEAQGTLVMKGDDK